MNHQQQQQQQQNHNNNQQNMVQVQVNDNLVSVIEDNKDHKDIISAQLAQAQLQHLNDSHNLNHQSLAVQQLQHLHVQQVLDNVVNCLKINKTSNRNFYLRIYIGAHGKSS